MFAKLTAPPVLPSVAENAQLANGAGDMDAMVTITGEDGQLRRIGYEEYERSIEAAKQIAKENPRMVAGLVTGWASGNDK
jgi:flagellar M-ring protein FliF